MLISDEHLQRYRVYYAGKEVVSRPHRWQEDIERLIAETDAESVLDYGSGIARSLERHLMVPTVSYDPAILEIAAPPEPADIVVCNHTMEHVELECVNDVLQHLKSLTKKVLYLAISLKPSTKVLMDGTPWHSTVLSRSDWHTRCEAVFGTFEDMSDNEQFFMIWRA